MKQLFGNSWLRVETHFIYFEEQKMPRDAETFPRMVPPSVYSFFFSFSKLGIFTRKVLFTDYQSD